MRRGRVQPTAAERARSAADGGKTLRAGDELKMTIEAQRRARRRLDREQDQV